MKGAATIDSGADQVIYNTLAGVATLALLAYGLTALVRFLRRSRPGLTIGLPIAIAAGVRIIAAAGVSLTSIGAELRGGDEVFFVGQAEQIAATPFGSGEWISALTGELHKFVLALQIDVLGSPDFALRMTEIGITVVGLTLLATAVYELAGARAAIIAAWVLALEPSGVFFSSILHKEANMFLAEGLVAFGGARMWKRGDLASLAIITGGCLVAVATRPYAGWFLIAAGAAVTLHAGLRTTRKNEVNALALIAIVVLFSAIAAPTVWRASSDESLEQHVQVTQEANAAKDDANLSLEVVDFSTRWAVITNLPQRMFDVVFRPYVWQVGTASQRLGAIGGLVTLVVLALLVDAMVRRRGEILARAGPLVYLAFFLLMAYSLSTGNAGTGFRYRTHIVAAALGIIVTLRASQPAPVPSPQPRAPSRTLPEERYAGV